MFVSTSKWGFPHKVARVVSQFNNGALSIGDALIELSKMYSSTINTYYTYIDGKKCGHTCIEFGCPVVARYNFEEVR